MGMYSYFEAAARGAERFTVDWARLGASLAAIESRYGKHTLLHSLWDSRDKIHTVRDLGDALNDTKLFSYQDEQRIASLQAVSAACVPLAAAEGTAAPAADSAGSAASAPGAVPMPVLVDSPNKPGVKLWEVPDDAARLYFSFESADDLSLGFLELRPGTACVRYAECRYNFEGRPRPFGSRAPLRILAEFRAKLPVNPDHDPRFALLELAREADYRKHAAGGQEPAEQWPTDGSDAAKPPAQEERKRLLAEYGVARDAYMEATHHVFDALLRRALLPAGLALFTVDEHTPLPVLAVLLRLPAI